jgi:hypothetical protein
MLVPSSAPACLIEHQRPAHAPHEQGTQHPASSPSLPSCSSLRPAGRWPRLRGRRGVLRSCPANADSEDTPPSRCARHLPAGRREGQERINFVPKHFLSESFRHLHILSSTKDLHMLRMNRAPGPTAPRTASRDIPLSQAFTSDLLSSNRLGCSFIR